MLKYIYFLTLLIGNIYLINTQTRVESINDRHSECVLGVGVDLCSERMNIVKSTGKDDYFLFDKPGEISTKGAWKITGRKKGYFGPVGSEVNIVLESKDKNVFKMDSLKLKVKYCAQVFIVAMIELNGRSHYVFEQTVEIEDPNEITDVISHRTNATLLKFTFSPSDLTKRINIKNFNMKACRQQAAVNPNFFKIGSNIKKNLPSCTGKRVSVNEPDFFKVYDNDGDRDEKLALNNTEGAPPYMGARGKDVLFHYVATDGGDFEWTSACVHIRLACAVEYTLFANDVTYTQTNIPCDTTIRTRMCFNPWGRDITVKKGSVRIIACPKSKDEIEITKLRLSGCRDHWKHKYTLHTNPGDSRVVTINTIKNETITKYAKKVCGEMVQSEMLNYKDEADEIDFTIFFGENSLVNKIITTKDTIKFRWRLEKPEVVISIISDGGRYQADTRVDLSEKVLHELLNSGKKKKRKKRQVCPEQEIRLNIFVKQCQALVPNALVFADILPEGKDEPVRVYGGPSSNMGMYDITLPKRAAEEGRRKELCDNVLEIHQEECKRHSVITRARYNLICKEIMEMLQNFTSISSDDPMLVRIRATCSRTFRAINSVCRAMLESPKPGQPTFFQEACNSGVNFTEEDLYKELGQNIEATFFTRNQNGIITPGKTRTLKLDKINYFSTTLIMKDISADIFSVPIRPLIQYGYKISMHYNCGADERNISISLASPALGRHRIFTNCTGQEADDCSCCDFLVDGATQILKLSDEVLMDHLKIIILRRGRRIFERNYFIQVHSPNELL